MRSTLILPDVIVTMDSSRRVLRGGGILVRNGIIERVMDSSEVRAFDRENAETIEWTNLTAIPGFVQTHVHLCQTLFRGRADDLELLDWLRLRILPFEAAHSPSSLRASALLGLAELIRSGTTCIMDMGAIHHEEEIVQAVRESGIRAFLGKAMMDLNDLVPGYREATDEALRSTQSQAREWHGSSGGRIRYAVAPRFVLSCSEELLSEAHAMLQDFDGMLFHTHAAENRAEVEAVRRRCSMDNIEYFSSCGLLGPNTCLAHCIWLQEHELDLLARSGSKVLHCPSSNLKLGSGIARVPEMLSRGINVSLGADGAPCNNTLDVFQEMRLAALIQKPHHGPSAMRAEAVFEMATCGGAEALGLAGEVGSIEVNKRADIVFLDLGRTWNPITTAESQNVYSSIVYSCSPENVRATMVDGSWLYKEGRYVTLDETAVVAHASEELMKLLNRM